MAEQITELLHKAIARNVGVVLSLPSAGMLRHYKSRFLSESDEGVMVEAPPGEQPLIAELIATAQSVGISFKQGAQKTMFASPVLRIISELSLNNQTKVYAILIGWPQGVKSIQRRSNYRVTITSDSEVAIRVWRINERALIETQPIAAQEITAEIRNLSTGGAGVRLIGKDDRPPIVSTEDRLRVQLTIRDQVLVMEGCMRSPTGGPRDNFIIAGIQFKKMERDLEGRKSLTLLSRLVGELQREEIRRQRLGMTLAG